MIKGFLLGMAFSLCPLALTATEIVVDAAAPQGAVNHNIFGHNVCGGDGRGLFVPLDAPIAVTYSSIKLGEGFWDHENRTPNKSTIEMVKTIAPGMLRYPGGCLAHNYDWRMAVGPVEEREKRGWYFGLDDYLAVCRALGAEPMITCSDYVLPANEMPAHLASLVEYLNSPATPEHPWAMKRKEWGHPAPYGVKWFELGNESAHGNHQCKPYRCFTNETYADFAEKAAAAMRAVDPSIKLGVAMSSGYDSADFKIIHVYGPKINGEDLAGNFKSCMAYPEYLERNMRSSRAKVKETCGRDLPLALTEYNLWFFEDKPRPWRFSAMAGHLCADMQRVFLKPESNIAAANYWQIANGPFGSVLTSKKNVKIRGSVFPFFQLWGQHFGGKLLPAEVKNPPCFDAPASEGFPAAKGDAFVAESKAGAPLDFGAFFFSELPLVKAAGSSPAKGELIFKLNGVEKPAYINIGLFKNVLKGSDKFYRMSFESRFIPEEAGKGPNGQLGLSLLDQRGWDQTHSSVAVDGIEMDKDWTFHKCDFLALPDCEGINIVFRVNSAMTPVKGTLEARNFKVEAWTPASEPAYQGLTAAASLSDDGKTLHLIVFNKSYDKDIESSIDLRGFSAKTATSWTAAPKPDAMDYEAPVEKPIALPTGMPLNMTFPAHSMTAIDFR